MDEVRTRLIEELRLRTEGRVRYWNQLGDWCRQRPGRYIGVELGPDLRGGSSSVAEETTRTVTGELVEEGVSDNSRATGSTVNVEQVSSSIEAENLNFESSAELGDEALNEFWDLWDIQKELQDLIEIENSKEKSSVVEQPD